MGKNFYFIFILIAILVLIYGLFAIDYKKPIGVDFGSGASDPLNAVFLLDGRAIKLKDRFFESEISPGSNLKMRVSVFGQPIYGDLNRDGYEDALIVLTVDMGGSGTFYYVTVALNSSDGWRGTNAILLGDRISPQTSQIENNLAIVNYVTRKEGDPMTAVVSEGVSDYFYIEGGTLIKAELLHPNIFPIEPKPDRQISSPLEIFGYARGFWFFEADFPVYLTDWDGKIIAQGVATAQGDWMTTSFVPFKAVLNFINPYLDNQPEFMKTGILILKKDNPSGLSEHDDALEFRVSF